MSPKSRNSNTDAQIFCFGPLIHIKELTLPYYIHRLILNGGVDEYFLVNSNTTL